MAQGIQLYSMNTPNGQKIGIALEEMEIQYTPHIVNLREQEQFKQSFTKISPYSKIPAIIDPDGPDGKPISVFESGAILIYLAQKSGRFWPSERRRQSAILEWLFFQVGGVGPMFGQFGHFFKHAEQKDQYGIDRYTQEAKRVLDVLEKRLDESVFLAGDHYSIADMATVTWVNGLFVFYEAEQQLGLAKYRQINDWKNRILERPKVKKGLLVCKPN